MDAQDTQLDSLANNEIQQEEKREKICISITEGCIRHYNEEPEIEEQFILRLPEMAAKEVHEALENEFLENHLEICVQKNLRDASVLLDGKRMEGKIMDLPTIIESYKMADESTFFKSADISQILLCSDPIEDQSNNESSCETEKKSDVSRKNLQKFQDGLCPPLKNARKKRFRKIILEESFDPDVDRCVKLLLRADGAAESIRYEVIEEEATIDDDTTEDSRSNYDENSNLPNVSNEIDVFGETLSVSSTEDAVDRDTDEDYSEDGSEFDTDIGNIENYDLEELTEEQKDHLAQLKEIDWCLSSYDFRVSPPPAPAPSRGRGRGRPRNDCKLPKLKKDKATAQRSLVGRGGRGRPPKRGRGHM